MTTENENRIVELWECRSCGQDNPCIVEINTKAIATGIRFQNRICLCYQRKVPYWKNILHCPVSHVASGEAVVFKPENQNSYPWEVEA